MGSGDHEREIFIAGSKNTGFSKFGRRVGYCGSKSAQQTAQRL